MLNFNMLLSFLMAYSFPFSPNSESTVSMTYFSFIDY